MRKLLLVVVLTLPMAPAFAEVTLTGTQGGTIEKSRDCARGGGQASCSTGTLYTAPDGQAATKTRVRTTEAGSSTTDVTVTGPEGKTKTRNRTTTWGN